MTGRLQQLVLRCLTLCVLFGAWPAQAEEITLGVYANRPKEIVERRFQPLADYLSQQQPGLKVRLAVLGVDEMDQALRSNRLDMLLTSPSHLLALRHQQRLSGAIATMETSYAGKYSSALGGLIFTRADHDDLMTLNDLAGRRVAHTRGRYLAGYQSQVHVLKEAGVRVPEDLDLMEVDNYDAVFQAVLQGSADAGFVRAGMLEALADEGRLDRSLIRVINPQSLPDFPFQVSTRLYPEWAFSVLPHLDEKLVRRIAAALFNIDPESPVAVAAGIHGFTIPADYLPVENLARELRMPPFDQAPVFTAGDVWQRFQWTIAAFVLLGGAVLALAVRLLLVNRNLRMQRAQVAESEETFRRLYEDTLDPVLIIKQRRYASANRAALDLLGMRAEELLGRTPEEISPEFQPDGQRSADKAQRNLDLVDADQPVVMDWTHRRADGSLLIVEVSLTPLLVHGERIVYCGWTDITQRKAAEERSGLLAVALESAGNGIVITDVESRIEWANPAFARLTGYTLEESIGRPLDELVRSGMQPPEFFQQVWETILSAHEWRGEVINRRKTGELYNELLTITPVVDDKGKILHFVAIQEDITERKRLENELLAQATTDTLTGLVNRRYFFGRLEEELNRLRRLDVSPVSLLMLDLDFFKQVNDTLGHAAGDAVLRHLAGLLTCDLRETDLAGRLGGEEFAVILPGANLQQALARADRFREAIQQNPVEFEGQRIAITASFGVTELLPEDNYPDQALNRADAALYLAKAGGRNRVEASK